MDAMTGQENRPQPTAGQIQVGIAQSIGMRKTQQDRAATTNNGSFAVLADGMGGLSEGGKASETVVRSAVEYMRKYAAALSMPVLLQGVRYMNASVNDMLEDEGLRQCGTTMICTHILERRLLWASVGDSRIYLYRGGGLVQLNREHNLLHRQRLQYTQGTLLPSEMAPRSHWGYLTSYIGMGTPEEIDFPAEPVSLCEGDWVILMSDGVYHFLPEPELLAALHRSDSPQTACDNVLEAVLAKKHPHQDNTTIVIQGV